MLDGSVSTACQLSTTRLVAVKDFFYRAPGNVTQYWYNQGASGWRFDVADDGNFPHAWWVDYRTYAKSYNSNGPLIGEIWPNASQWLAGDQMDAVMNYRFRKNITGFRAQRRMARRQ